jgi:uncharacterized protein (TIGR02099 family)
VFLKYCFAFLKHGSLWVYRVATVAVLLAGVSFVVLVLGLRYLVLPNIDSYRSRIESAITRAAGQPVEIGSVTANWQGYRPELHLNDVKVLDGQRQPALELARVDAVLAWLSLLAAEVRFDSLEVQGPRLEVRRGADGTLHVAGIALGRGGGGGFGDWLLNQRQILVRDAAIVWIDDARSAPELRLEKVDFRLDNFAGSHEFGLTGSPPAAVASAVAIRGEFSGRTMRDLQAWTGRLYAEFGQVSLPLAQAWVETPMALSSGTGSLRVWLHLAGTHVTDATADLRLSNVRGRLGPELPELALASLEGRLGWTDDGIRSEVSATSLAFTTADGMRLAPMRFSFARSGEAGPLRLFALDAERLDLAPIVQLAEFLPLDPRLRARLKQSAPTGMIERGRFSWHGAFDRAQPYAARATFSDVSLQPDGVLPGVRRLSGEVDATERGGTATLSVTAGSIELPRAFSEPIPLEVLSAGIGWSFSGGRALVVLRNATFTNEHAAGTVQGSYQTEPAGPGSIDLTATLIRADARNVWRYIPVTAPVTQAWLRKALLAGESRDVRARLKGRLADFPFEDPKKGLFEVVARASGVTVDYARGWPALNGISGDITFRGRRMEAHPQGASLLGIRLADLRVSIPELGKRDEHLLVKGTALAPTSEFLRFVASSPVAAHIDRFTEEIRAKGDARLDLQMDLPLHRIAESSVAGELVVSDNQVTIDTRLPELEKFGARIAFARDARNKGSVNVREGRALLLGNPVTFEAANQADGGVVLKLAGNLEARRLADLADIAPLRFLDGSFAWTGNVSVRNKIATLRFESDLAGLASRLPEPLAKPAADKLPLAIEMRERPGRQGSLGVTLGGIVAAQLAIDGTGQAGIRRGMISFGEPAMLPRDEGLWIRGRMDRLDVDAWNTVLKGGGTASAPDIAGINLQIASLDFSRRRFHDLKIDVAGQGDAWQGAISGREIAGQVSWAPQGNGRLSARFAKLALPAPASGVAPPPPAGESLPSLDVVAESFSLEGRDLGRLTVRADPDATGWRLQQLDVVNPDARLSVNGHWATQGEPRTDVAVKLDVLDIGKFFQRMKYPEGIKGGTATLEGPVGWQGGPSRLDIRSLTGRLKLEARDGRFQQINPGAAKLLGIVSLQALPKRLSFDFDDIFRKGFTFDRIRANLDIAAGIAQTSDFAMEGSAAKVAMKGTVDLAAETQNLTLRVTPSLSESIAVAGAIVNPAVGVAALIAQKALKDPFSSIAAFEYALTGTWVDPVVTRIPKGADSGVPGRGR